MRDRALIGMMWGIAHNGTNAALKVFTDLNPQNQAASIHPLADSYSMAKGFTGADELLAMVPGAFRETAINSMLPHLTAQPAEDFMNWSAKYCEENPQIGAGFRGAAAKACAQSPEMAAQWAERNAGGKATSAAAGIVMESLVASRPDLVRTWLDRNANHPAASALRAGLAP